MKNRTSGHMAAGTPRMLARQDGSMVVIVMVFALVFLTLGLALYWLVSSATDSTELERTDVKAFNVAEAGVDAGMRALALDWPESPPTLTPEEIATEKAEFEAALKEALQAVNASLHNPSRSDLSEFIQVAMYDNVDTTSGEPYLTTTVADTNAPTWDYNRDDKMFVDAESNVDDDRHRVIVLAERQVWPLRFPVDVALFARQLESGAGMTARNEDGTPPIFCCVTDDPQKKGLAQLGGMYSYPNEQDKELDDFVNATLLNALLSIADRQGTYFEGGASATAETNGVLVDLEANLVAGSVIYLQSTDTPKVRLGQSIDELGTVDKPVVIVVDAPAGTVIEWAGDTTIYGILVTLGNGTLSGTPSIHGALYCDGKLTNNGTADTEVVFNQTVIQNINRGSTVSVNIVPNTWEEYTLPKGPTAEAGG